MRHYKRGLVAAALATTVVTGTAGWASGTTQQAMTGPPPGSQTWLADASLGRPLPDPVRAAPAEVASFFRGLDERQRHRLARRHPGVVGNLDGVPVDLRYKANALSASRDVRYAHLAGRRLLAFDPRGRGLVAEVFGDLEHSRHVAVVVPGADIDAGSYDRPRDPYGTPAGMARQLRSATGGRTAVVAWAGYTTPVGIGLDAATGGLAEAGARRLVRLADGFAATGTAAPSLFCHSYGSVVCGLAAAEVKAKDLVVFGSPGMRAANVAELGTAARVWAAKGPTDWISEVPHTSLLGLGHGRDPVSEGFGSRRVPAEDARGHSGYLAPGTTSLRAFAAIARGEAA
ncbi:alpha/beta hydrolase family protein [Streptomyces somaliensis]|uniref:alpha/beta hydrolase n=1 Tax=Streptomyces somaliensis TaxID=78355 RepID=UPI0020CE8C78|nr:alpha/beta hydrolase [Streptomyces somaliensis]MCP9945932.1 alpha/beta hydrolase family protein [Streptomyces somaliensis]MCP9960893.1 alpha/beta hydrolase family protein [Streptomyces somaliensis]